MKRCLVSLVIIMFSTTFAQVNKISEVKGNYFGQEYKASRAEVFAPGIISTENREFYISFSRDNKLCIFCRDMGGTNLLYSIQTSDGWSEAKPVPFYKKGFDGYFIMSPEKKRVYFSSKRSLDNKIIKLKNHKLWYMDFTEGKWEKPKPVDFLREKEIYIGHSTFTNNGSIYFYDAGVVNNDDQADIYTAEMQDGKLGTVKRLSSLINTKYNECDPLIDPQERFIIYAVKNNPECYGDFDLFISFKKEDGSWTKGINMGEKINTKEREIHPRITPDGKCIFFSSNRSGNWDIYWFDSKLVEELRPSKNINLTKYSIIYSSDETGNPEIYLSDINGKEKLQLTNHELRDGYATCSPDGSKIAFYRYHDEGKTWSIWTMNKDGSNKKQLTYKKLTRDSQPRWSPDSKNIIFSRNEGDNYKICVMTSDGTNIKTLKIPFGMRPVYLSNEKILFITHWDETGEICISDADGTNIKKLTSNSYKDSSPDISPDGKSVVFVSTRNDERAIYKMNVDGTDQIKLTNNYSYASGPKYSPDGQRITFGSTADGDWDLYIMNSDGSNLKRITNNEFYDSPSDWLK